MKKTKRLFAFIFCGALIIAAAVPAGLATQDSELQNRASEPVMQAFSKNGAGGSEVQFSAADFLSKISDSYTLKGIVIASLPDPDTGVLKYGSRDLLTGEAITADSLDELRFVPNTTRFISTHFTFLPVFNEETELEQVTVGINLIGKENQPPVAEGFKIETCKNVAAVKLFKATDPDGDPLTYKITGKPKRGQVEILEDGSFKYTPYENKTGKDSMTYTATDAFGNESSEAKIEIVIEKAPSRVSYADMDGNAAHYAALKMAEKGVYVGEKIGDKYYFNPNAEMTRGEFLTTLVTALGLHDGREVTRTGFADDSEIPAWLKPYASSALKAGMISGITTSDGKKALFADNSISRAEAAVMVNNACKIDNAGVMAVFADGTDIPAWATQAISNLSAADLLEAYSDGTIRLGETMTREQGIQLAYNALKYAENNNSKGGLLNWAFGI